MKKFGFKNSRDDGEHITYWDRFYEQEAMHCFYKNKDHIGELKLFHKDGDLIRHEFYDADSNMIRDFIINPVTPEEMMILKLKYEGPWI